ncbi:MAG: hypothetical protein MMC23_003036 [Stictis urceolatum]|nr:hypothetical protein [Stictis urceolata]
MASAGGDAAAISSTENNGPTPRYKSFKKKYMKIRKQFSDTMIKNNTQWEAEQKLMKTARRLEEELDQLREILVDVNESSFNPAHLRINLRSSNPEEDAFLASMGATSLPPDDFDILDNNTKYSPESAALVLAEAKKELSSGTITTSDFEALATSVQPYLRKSIALSYLETQVAHTRLADVEPSDLPPDIGEANPVGYLTPEHEAEYLERLDAELDGRAAAYSHPIRGPTLNAARDNPMSALNWLRQNQPQVFLQDSEAQETAKQMKRGSHDGPIKERSSGRGKRGSVAHEVLDDEGFVVGAAAETLGSVRGKRKRAAEDDAYNPKGGGGRRKGKKQSLGAEHD